MTRWVCAARCLCRELPDGGLFVVNEASGGYVTLNASGRLFLEAVEQGLELDDIVERFTQRFAAEPLRIRSDLTYLAKELTSHGLIAPDTNVEDLHVPGA